MEEVEDVFMISSFERTGLCSEENGVHAEPSPKHHLCVCVCVTSADDSRLRFSSRRVAVSVGSLLDDQHWHSVHIERFNRQVNLTVDSHTQHFQTKGEGHSLEVDYEVSAR